MRLAEAVDSDVEMGFHFCYGDIQNAHFVQPEDMRVMVDLANSIVRKVAPVHAVRYIHMPVPKERVDEGYFGALGDLKLGGTKLFLGLVHPRDEDGTRRRIEVAWGVYGGGFGVGTECGFGRMSPEQTHSVLGILASVTALGDQ